jgi:hypothetical protein
MNEPSFPEINSDLYVINSLNHDFKTGKMDGSIGLEDNHIKRLDSTWDKISYFFRNLFSLGGLKERTNERLIAVANQLNKATLKQIKIDDPSDPKTHLQVEKNVLIEKIQGIAADRKFQLPIIFG